MKRIKLLIIDDSAVMRRGLSLLFEADDEIEVMGTAADPFIAAGKIADSIPDVITLDVEMPRMDGLTFLKKLMSQYPIPVVVISSLTARGTESAILAMEYGAVSVIKKPGLLTDGEWEEGALILEEVKAAAAAKIRRKKFDPERHAPLIKRPYQQSMAQTTDKIIAVGASTGGTEAILELLKATPYDSSGIVIVQHMPEIFTRSFAERLDSICKITVKEASDGDTVIRGRALIAPGNKHMQLKRSGSRYYVSLNDAPPVNRHRPSVDVLFSSVAKYAGKNAIGVIMTGMGNDGAKGLLEMRNANAYTIAQDEESSVVFGMPKEAIKLQAVNKVLPLNLISAHIQTISRP